LASSSLGVGVSFLTSGSAVLTTSGALTSSAAFSGS